MSITLYVVRHGDAVIRAATDAERPLSQIGEGEAALAASNLAGISPDLFLASPYLRAQQTANIIKEQLQIKAAIETEKSITPDDHPVGVVELLSKADSANSILMVSHNPLVSALVSLLVDGHYQGPYAMGTASVACIEFDVFGVGLGTLKWLKHANR